MHTILKRAKTLVNKKFPHFGVNKNREITRLLFEISKRDTMLPEEILENLEINNFEKLKNYLLEKRYPVSYSNSGISSFYLPKIGLNNKLSFNPGSSEFYPKRIFIEQRVSQSALAKKFKKLFPESEFTEIQTLKDYLKAHSKFTIADYNNRRNNIFIAGEMFDFFKCCPCTKDAIGCGYNIFNLGFGCIFECAYCYLQEYTNNPGIILPANTDDFFNNFSSYKKRNMRIGTGEFSDSLMLDNITGYSPVIIDFFKKHKNAFFEFKTKSKNIKNLLKANHAGNIVVSWSLNPQRIINENEFFTASLSERINSAVKCSNAGYKIGLHFDPVFYYDGYEKDYKELIGTLFSKISPKSIAWISIGTFRFKPQLKKIIENRFPSNTILDEELILGYDNKLRYPYSIRLNVYKTLTGMMQKYSKKLPVYLCMEEKSMWKDLNLKSPFI